jgi:hypothetical protein
LVTDESAIGDRQKVGTAAAQARIPRAKLSGLPCPHCAALRRNVHTGRGRGVRVITEDPGTEVVVEILCRACKKPFFVGLR